MKNDRNYFIKLAGFIILLILHEDRATFAQQHGVATKRQQATSIVISLFDKLVSKNILGAENLKYLLEHPTLVNPIDASDADSSDAAFTYREQLNKIISSDKQGLLDLDQIHEWTRNRIQELEKSRSDSAEVYDKTHDLHQSMGFATVPLGHYQSSIDESVIDISEDIELQITPITQHQWLQVMGNNPSKFNEGLDSEEIAIGDKKIRMRADALIETVDLNQIQEFIKKLNDSDQIYSYDLPSVDEYDAALQASMGKNWTTQINSLNSCVNDIQTCSRDFQKYAEYGNKRIFGIIGNVWQWTRDTVEASKPFGSAHLVFGMSFATKKHEVKNIAELLRPILYSDSKGESVGFRVIRFKKEAIVNRIVRNYEKTNLSWHEELAERDVDWKWYAFFQELIYDDKNILSLMMQHKNLYPEDIQHTLDAIFKTTFCNGDMGLIHSSCFKSIEWLNLYSKEITNIEPIAFLTDLQFLNLDHNLIKDLSSLSQLTNLKALLLSDNQIKDVSALSQLNNVAVLSLANNEIIDVSFLSRLTNLEALYLSNNKIENVESLSLLTNLMFLDISHNHIKDVSPLSRLTNLRELKLNNNHIEDSSPLESLKQTKIDLEGNQRPKNN